MERKKQDPRKYEGLNLNQLTTKYPKRHFNLPITIDLELTSSLAMANPK